MVARSERCGGRNRRMAHGAACDRVHKLEQIVEKLRPAEATEIVLRP